MAATIQSQALELSIEVNGNNNLAFGSSCMQMVDLATEASCSSSPTLVSTSVNDQLLMGVGPNYVGLQQGGF